MTPDEERMMRQRVQAILAPGMMDQTAGTPEQLDAARRRASASTVGAQAQLAAQQQYADTLRGTKIPEGRTAGNLFVAADPLEGLATVANQGIGAMMMGKLGKKYEAIDAAETEAKEGEFALEDIRTQGTRDYTTGERIGAQGFTTDERIAGETQATLEREAGQDFIDAQRIAEGIETAAQNEADRNVDLVGDGSAFVNVKDKDDTIEGIPTANGSWLMPDPEDSSKMVPMDHKKYRREYKPSSTAGGYRSNTRKTEQRWVDEFGDELYTYVRGGQQFNADTNKVMPENWRKEGGWYEQPPMSEGTEIKAMQDLEKRADPILGLMNNMTRAEERGVLDTTGKEPGESTFGWFSKQAGNLGGASRALGDLINGNEDLSTKYAAARTVANEIIRLRAGLSQTITETANVMLESGQDFWSDPAVFDDWWRRLDSQLNEDLRRVAKFSSPRILRLYQNREAGRREVGGDSQGGLKEGQGEKSPGGVIRHPDWSDEQWTVFLAREAKFGGTK